MLSVITDFGMGKIDMYHILFSCDGIKRNKLLYLSQTLVIDHGRFMDVRDKANRLTLVASILLVTYGTIGTSIQGVQSLKEKMKSEICTILEGVTAK